ncbi:MAG TPA: hypothetical protein VNK70_00660 [Candidatus Paceibacterota bacterium]|nr:hypothetical protein [Candidatus Paceibacterota bacterium]
MAEKKEAKDVSRELEWSAAEYQFTEKSPGWYWLVALTGVAIALFSLIKNNFFFAIFIAIATLMVISLGRRKPRVIEFRLSDTGVAIGDNTFYDYDRLEGFAFLERPGRLHEIVLKKKVVVNPYFKMPIDAKSAEKAKTILLNHLPEMEHEESLLDAISDWLGF